MPKVRKSRQKSVAVQSTDLFNTELESGQQSSRLCKKKGFRNLLQKSVTVMPQDNTHDAVDSVSLTEGRRIKSVQASADRGQTFQNPMYTSGGHSLDYYLSGKPSRDDEPWRTTSEMVRVIETGPGSAVPGTSRMTSVVNSSISVLSQLNNANMRTLEGSSAVVYNYGDKTRETSRSSNPTYFYGSQGSRRFSDETVLLIEDYQSYDVTNTARRQEVEYTRRQRSRTCCGRGKRSSVDILTRPVPIDFDEVLEKDEAIVCRICHEGEEVEPLIQPCLCKGSVGCVHARCLKIWLEQSNTSRCELCNYPYAIRQTIKYTKFYSVFVFFRTVVDRRTLAYDVISFVIITPLTLVGVAMCIQAALTSTAADSTDANYQMGNITKVGMVMLSGTIVVAYGVWLYTLISFHYKAWKKWYSNCYDVEVLPVRMTSEERFEAARRLSEEMSRRQLSREHGSALLTVLNSPRQTTYNFYQRRMSGTPVPPGLHTIETHRW